MVALTSAVMDGIIEEFGSSRWFTGLAPTMIPSRIHYCWFGNQPKSPMIQQCLASWQKIMPDYPLTEWNERNAPLDWPYVREGLKQKRWSRVANVVRLHALYQDGGLYFDTDLEVLRPFDDLLANDCFLAFQQRDPDVDWIANGVIGAVPRHPFIKAVLETTIDQHREQGVFRRAPELITEMLRGRGLTTYGDQVLDGVRLLPADYFYPYPWWEHFDPACVTPRTYAIHHWQISWLDPALRAAVIKQRRRWMTAQLVEQRIEYAVADAGQVELVWGIGNWSPPPQVHWPAGSRLQNRVLHTPMTGGDGRFTVALRLPPDTVIKFGFAVVRDAAGNACHRWDAGGDHGFDCAVTNPPAPLSLREAEHRQ